VTDDSDIALMKQEDSTKELTLKTAAMLIASGVDPKKSTLFVQSHVSEHCELMWILASFANLSLLNNMIQFKEKKSSD